MSRQVTTLRFFRFSGGARWWAFGMMQFAHPALKKSEGQLFYKLMGSGKSGFNPWPDYSTYALLQVWESDEAARAFHARAPIAWKYIRKCDATWTLYLKNSMSRGKWDGQNPFQKSNALDPENPVLAVITRATIRTSRLRRFWKHVPYSQEGMDAHQDLMYTKGIGEVPFTQMATFSIWESLEGLNAFAYQQKNHVSAIKLTRELNWYKEELFSRFQPYDTEGNWPETEVLKALIKGKKKTKEQDLSGK